MSCVVCRSFIADAQHTIRAELVCARGGILQRSPDMEGFSSRTTDTAVLCEMHNAGGLWNPAVVCFCTAGPADLTATSDPLKDE